MRRDAAAGRRRQHGPVDRGGQHDRGRANAEEPQRISRGHPEGLEERGLAQGNNHALWEQQRPQRRSASTEPSGVRGRLSGLQEVQQPGEGVRTTGNN